MMRWLFILWLALVTASAAEPPRWRATVLRVVDGDTVRMRREGKQVSVRLDSIDAPERGQAGGPEAKRAFARFLPEGSEVAVVSFGEDPLPSESDKCIELMVSMSILNWCGTDRLVYSRYCRDLRYWGPLEGKARRERLGLWASRFPGCLPGSIANRGKPTYGDRAVK